MRRLGHHQFDYLHGRTHDDRHTLVIELHVFIGRHGFRHWYVSAAIKRFSTNGHNILRWHRPSLASSLGWCYQFTHSDDQFVDGFGRERGLAIARAYPGIHVRHSDRNTVFTILECGRAPLFQDLMFTTSWNRVVSHSNYFRQRRLRSQFSRPATANPPAHRIDQNNRCRRHDQHRQRSVDVTLC